MLLNDRIVITGMGVVAPNAIGLHDFHIAIKTGKSGISFISELEKLKFRCQVAGVPPISETDNTEFREKYRLANLKSTGILYGIMASVEAWRDAGLPEPDRCNPDDHTGCIFGTGSNGVEATSYGIEILESVGVHGGDGCNFLQVLNSGVSAYIGYLLGLGNQTTSNASACNTGTEALIMAANRIKMGLAERMIVGSSESDSPYVWAPFDSMFATAQGFNATPEKASCPMSKNATGFVPSSGAGAFIVESLSSAKERGARIYAEVLGGQINSGGQRGDGSMTLGNQKGIVKCIQDTLRVTNVRPEEIDFISGHLSSTIGDIREIQGWSTALNLPEKSFPYINATKSMIGHCLSASGAIETVGTILQLYHGFIHPSINSEDVHPDVEKLISPDSIPQTAIERTLRIAAKISLGFGDVNSCVILERWGN
ncbi:beta-ketoacyl synthase [Dyadobacter sp. CY312]|uniref:beta-ketoacyl-[acyl-carrier-protein] synthase family protein n=1 Tax=Dyadobacter sp. CY312 TaxID=2907303 RepID=UPI001F341539|nr:beta-ketoacyl-[acyl-carrier-protein] synthase family protein [Dyadobacter sp. CY312]MCE7044572.1 beta-ketoacyl-[acyl-carrier-protein] synthase family protein [Dyadobacter sp. CY312]